MFITAFAFIKRDFLLSISYKSAYFIQITAIFFAVVVFYYVGEVIGPFANPILKAYANNYFAFLLIGIALFEYMSVSVTIFNRSIRDSQMMGTLEVLLLSPLRLSLMLLYSSLWAYIFTTLRFICYLSFGIVMFGLDIGNGNVVGALIVLILSVLCFGPLGVVSATIIMVFKKGDWFRLLLISVSSILGGVLYPLSILPDWLRAISFYVPMTHSLEGMRQALLNGYSVYQLLPDILFLCIFALIFMPLSVISFELAVNRTKKTGRLSHY